MRSAGRRSPVIRWRSFRLGKLNDFQGPARVGLLPIGHLGMRSARTVTTSRIHMTSHSPGRGSRRTRGGRSRRGGGDRPYRQQSSTPKAPVKQTLWEKIAGFFTGNGKQQAPQRRPEQPRNGSHPAPRPQSRKPESVEVTTPRLYVGNLSFDATESDLFELFNGVGQVQNAEVVTYKHNQRSKGFAFVQMQTVEEAKRAVSELHDKEFLGRKLLVSGAKSSEHHASN